MPAGKETKGARTLATYEASAQVYIDRTERSRPELETFMKKFASAVGSGRILEIGSGPGWDAIYLEGLGLQVERTDATAAFVEILRADGVDARQLDAVTDDLGGPYDGIFANAVFLHLTREELSALLVRARASSGVLAFTLKEGDGEQWSTAKLDLPRHFTFWREQPLRDAVESAGWNVASLERVGEPGTQQWLFVVAT